MLNKFFIRFMAVLAVTFSVALVSCDKTPDPEDLGTSLTPANSHIISSSGTYNFQTVKGNSSDPVGAVASAEVLWESFGTAEAPAKGAIIAETEYIAKDGVIRFKTPSSLKDGNALIAAKDAAGNILWSWHIWVCKDWDPEKTAQTYYNNAGIMMDRNLGATTATPGAVTSLGLLYQWGRKDPFLGASSITEKVLASSTLQWPEAVASTAETGTIAYAISHPTTFIYSKEANYDWYYTGKFETDNTRWQTEKTIYDPCPAGWVLPTGPTPEDAGFWYTTYRRYNMSYDMDVEHRGMNFTKVFSDADPVWYPLAGFRADDDGQLWAVGKNSGFWTSTPDLDEDDPQAKVMAFGLDLNAFSATEVATFTATDYCRAVGFSVRCVAEKSAK